MATKTTTAKKAGAPQKYPWEKWLQVGKSFTIVKGKDFFSTTKTMIIQVYNNAKSRGLKVRIKELAEGKLHIGAYKPEEKPVNGKAVKTRRK